MEYKVYLNKELIGSTRFEKADPNMGVVTGQLFSINGTNVFYDIIKKYCSMNNIILESDIPIEKTIFTKHLPDLIINNNVGMEIKGQGNYIGGMDTIEFEITIYGIDNNIYKKEFNHHLNKS